MKVKKDSKIAWALVGLFIAFYWATFGGHTYSPDEEMLYYVIEGIVERQSFAVPAASATTSLSAGPRGVDGNNYAITGVLQSILAIPLYLLGKGVSEAFQPIFRPFWTRFFVCLFNGIIGGMTVSLMYLVSRKFEFRRVTSLFLAVGLGATTFLGVYARTFFSESLVAFWILLAVYAAYSYRVTSQAKWSVIWGLALGLSVATKPQALLAWPAFGLYAFLILFKDYTEKKTRFQWFLNTLGYGVLGIILPIILVLAYNNIRFGNFFQTGYSAVLSESQRFGGVSLEALYGFIFGSGRSFFLYAPLCVLSVFGIKHFYARHNLESVLFIALILSYLVFYSTFARWFTGGSWGPRYLSHIVPMALLPAAAYIETYPISCKWRYFWAVSLFIIGFAVQFGAIIVNFNAYYNSDLGRYSLYNVGWDAIIFQPSYSPVTGHWKLWPQRYQQWRAYDTQLLASIPEAYYSVRGDFYAIEDQNLAPFGFWTHQKFVVDIYTNTDNYIDLRVTYWRPESVSQAPLHYFVNGVLLESRTVITDLEGTSWYSDNIVVPVDLHSNSVEVVVEIPLWSPVVDLSATDRRMLGVFLANTEVIIAGENLPAIVIRKPFMPTLRSILEVHGWGNHATTWFWEPSSPHLADCWWWYIGYIGEAKQKVQVVRWLGGGIIGLVTLLSSLLLLSVMLPRRVKSNASRDA